MAQISEDKFLQIYGNLLVNTWAMPDLKARFKANPEEVLKEFGLDPGTAKVQLIPPMEHPTAECTPQSQVRMWEEGLQSGIIQFVYPDQPPEGAQGMELTFEQLEAVAGGGDACCCCSCTPCCSC